MKVKDQKLSVEFDECLNFIIPFHNRTMDLASLVRKNKNALNLFDKIELVLIEEAFLVKHVAEWEIFLQNIFAYCVSKNTAKLSAELKINLSPIIGFNNAYTILNGVDFISLTSMSKIKSLARKVLTIENNPFETLNQDLLKNIDEIYIIRNYLVHKSFKSKDKLQKLYKDKYQILEFINPGEFLLNTITEEGVTTTKSDFYYGGFMTLSVDIWKFLDITSYKFTYEDDTTKEGFLRGMEKMSFVFHTLTMNYNLL